MTKTEIRDAGWADAAAIFAVYQAAGDTGGLARKSLEVRQAHIDAYLAKALPRGVCMVAERDGRIIGEMHAWPMEPLQFAHVLSDLTIAIHPEAQGHGVGGRLFRGFLAEVRARLPHIRRIELGCRNGHEQAIRLYRSMGFEIEGRLRNRICDPDGSYEDDLIMGLWLAED
jgi:ribosomal protein S18 acetylase RimI-like enzyme